MRLNRYLAQCGVASRRKAEEFIRSGRISVNGQIIKKLAVQVDVIHDRVYLDERLIEPVGEKKYILLNKPKGVLTTVDDPFKRKTVMELIPEIPGLVPVGRLDFDTEGVILLTNDGELTFRLSHPRYEIDKIYLVTLNRAVNAADLEQLRTGVNIGDSRPARASNPVKVDERRIRLTLHEGRKRQIKRMFTALRYKVTALRREQFAFLRCDDLKPTSWRYLTREEIVKLKKIVGLGHGNSR